MPLNQILVLCLLLFLSWYGVVSRALCYVGVSFMFPNKETFDHGFKLLNL